MAKLTKRTVILAKLETVYATDASPTDAGDAVLINEASLEPVMADFLDRNLLTGELGGQPQMRVKPSVSCSFTVELAGSGAAGTAPAWGKLLLACGFAQTVSSSKVLFKPISSNFPSLSIHYVLDGTRHIMLGARGSVVFSLNANAIPTAAFSFVGLPGAISDVSHPSPTLTAWKTPLPPSTANTPTATLDGIALGLNELSIDCGVQTEHLDLISLSQVMISDRTITGSAVFLAPALADKNFFALALSSDLKAFRLVHGVTTGNIIEFSAPQVQLSELGYGNIQDLVSLNGSLRFTPLTGNDEISITTK